MRLFHWSFVSVCPHFMLSCEAFTSPMENTAVDTPPSLLIRRDWDPLPFALAVQDFGAFETHSLETQSIHAPTFPEGTQHEGLEKAKYPLTEYLSFLPTIKSLAIPCKSIDSWLKTGSAWWVYIVRNVHHTLHLATITLPERCSPVRSVYMAPTSIDEPTVTNIVKMLEDSPNYGVRMREMPGSNVRSFLALCHAPEEEWSYGASWWLT